MARPLRIEFPGATYHVMARGNQGQKICLDDHDREMWVAERLGMGYETRVSQAVTLVESSRQASIQAMKEKLNRCHV